MAARATAAILGLAVGAAAGSPAAAETIHVPGEVPTIQDAIAAAGDGDEILVAPGVYAEPLDLLGKAITLRAADGAETTTLDGSAFEGPVIQCISGESGETMIQGFRLIGANRAAGDGDTTHGGGIFLMNSAPTIVDCLFEANAADFGGGIYCLQSQPMIIGCTFRENSGSEQGGAIRNYDASPTILDCRFSGNAASIHGGAVASNDESLPVISGSTFCENTPEDVHGPWIDGGGNAFDDVCCPADLFADGVVDVVDLLALLALWGACPPEGPCPADLDADDEVGVNDLLLLLAAWGPCA